MAVHGCVKCVSLSQREMRAMIEKSYASGPLLVAKSATIQRIHAEMIAHVKVCGE